MDASVRYLRQYDLLDPEKHKMPITVIGAGATGSFTVLGLAKMGFNNITVYDEDRVEEHNFPTQFFPTNSLGENKAEALKRLVKDFTDIDITAKPIFYTKEILSGVVVSALDSMSGRQLILDNCMKNRSNIELLIDPRAGAEIFRVLSVKLNNSTVLKKYKSTIHTDEQSDPIPCTARAIVYSVFLLAGVIANQIKRHVMGQELKSDILIDVSSHFFYTK